MSKGQIHRDVSQLLQRVRAFLLGREHITTLRFEDLVARRTQPPPNVPGGPHHVLAANYYYKRDARREVAPPLDVHQQALIAAEGKPKKGLPTPGKMYRWD